jgi:hypothetical protein
MDYNHGHVITYNSVKEDDLKDHSYRLDFLKCFYCEHYDESIDKKISTIYNLTYNKEGFIHLFSTIREHYNIVNDHEMCLVYLFSYDYLHLFHEIISKFIDKQIIDHEKIKNLIEIIHNS